MKTAPVLHYPQPKLRTRAETVGASFFRSKELHELLTIMIATMQKLRGIGLAATQIDVHKQIAVIELQDAPLVVINPTIRNPSKRLEVDEEGCLSVPGVFGHVNRAASLSLTAFDEAGAQYSLKARGLFARVIQHEVDHLHGHLFLDRCHLLTSGLDQAKKLSLEIPPLRRS